MADFSMDQLYITDNRDEQIELGKKIFELKKDRYTDSLVDSIKETIRRNLPQISEEECTETFFRSIYDYWAYGCSIDEEFYFDFFNSSDKEKKEYITLMEHVIYCKHLNRQEDSHLLMNKYETYCILKDYYKRDVILIKDQSDYPVFCDFIEKHPCFVVKPTDLWQAKGVYKETFSGKTDAERKALFEELLGKGQQYKATIRGGKESSVVLEEVIEQGEELACLHPASVNCLRIPTIRIGDKIIIYRPYIKIGIRGNFLTAGFLRCPTAGINVDTGIVETKGITEDDEIYENHPDTGIRIPGFRIPDWDGLKKMAAEVANAFPTINIIGWDFAWSTKGWCIIEGNEKPEFGWQRNYQCGLKKEFEELIGWKPEKKFWWL